MCARQGSGYPRSARPEAGAQPVTTLKMAMRAVVLGTWGLWGASINRSKNDLGRHPRSDQKTCTIQVFIDKLVLDCHILT